MECPKVSDFLKSLQKIPTWGAVLITVILIYFLALISDKDYRDSPSSLRISPNFDWRLVAIFLDQLESMAIASAAILYFKEAPERKAQKHYEAWQVVDNAYASRVETSYARIEALEYLNAENVPLKGLDLYHETQDKGVDLEGISLKGGKLSDADLRRANLRRANLSSADLSSAKLYGADLSSADLSSAKLYGADLRRADLSSAKLYGADLSSANLSSANLIAAKYLTPSQIKSACYWEKAIYKGSWDDEQKKWIIDEEANQQYIDQLEEDKA